MNFNPETCANKVHKDCSSLPSPMKFQEDDLLSLLKRPLSCMDQHFPSSTAFHPPFSFETPFDDPSMEPEPLRSPANYLSPGAVSSSMAEPIFGGDDCLASPYLHKNELSRNGMDLCQSLLDILKPVIVESAPGSKRSYQELLECNDPAHATKRQRTFSSPLQAPVASNSEESTARFRPYQEKQWRTQFDNLILYKNENGHCCVPHSYKEDPILARWVKRQRYQYKKFNDGDLTSTMTSRRIQELESVGFVWHSHHAAWQEKLNELKEFKHRTGHCNVPSHYPENVSLSTWVKCQRRQYKLFTSGSQSHMTVERFQELESLGFVFDVRQTKLQRASSWDRSVRRGVSC